MTKLTNPVSAFYDGRGVPLSGGHIYVGVANADPSVSPLDVFWDEGLNIPATQPLRTIGGLIVNGTTPAPVFFSGDDFSLRVTDANDVLVSYSAQTYTDASNYQPKDADLTAIAVQGTTEYGRGLLALANQQALLNAIGGNSYLALNGGSVTGNITRQGAGVHAYWADPRMSGGRIFATGVGGADPTSQPGDIWLTF